MNKQKIFIVEDDEGIREVYEGVFEDIYDVSFFENSAQFFAVFPQKHPDLVILDIMLPDMDGYTILTKLRAVDERVPVIIVSAKADEMSFVKGLNKGADDYMAKPFSVMELLARVKAGLRRGGLYVSTAGNFRVDHNTYKIFYGEHDLSLTPKEYKLLALLIAKAGITIGRDTLFREVWGEDYIGETRTLDIHIATLRDKIKNAGGKDVIITVRGVGYRFEVI